MRSCFEAHPNQYIRLTLYNPALTKMTTALQFMVHRPEYEPGFRLDRQETHDRTINYTLHTYEAEKPHGERYQTNSD